MLFLLKISATEANKNSFIKSGNQQQRKGTWALGFCYCFSRGLCSRWGVYKQRTDAQVTEGRGGRGMACGPHGLCVVSVYFPSTLKDLVTSV